MNSNERRPYTGHSKETNTSNYSSYRKERISRTQKSHRNIDSSAQHTVQINRNTKDYSQRNNKRISSAYSTSNENRRDLRNYTKRSNTTNRIEGRERTTKTVTEKTVPDINKVIFFLNKYKKLIIVAIVSIFIISILISVVKNKSRNNSLGASDEQIESGVNYLEMLEVKDVSTVQAAIKEKEDPLNLDAMINGEISVWTQFSDSVIIGDSRATAFSYYDFVPEERTLAHLGAYIYEIEDYYLPQIAALNPSYAFFALGINDIGNGVWATSQDCADKFVEVAEAIRSVTTDCTIVINSILEATEPALSNADMWYDVPVFNDRLREACEANGYIYVDNDPLCEELNYLYEPDGIHVQYDFYEPWAMNMWTAVSDYKKNK